MYNYKQVNQVLKICLILDLTVAPVYFNSSTKTIINHRYKLDQSFQEILYRIDAWINRGSG